MNVHNDSQISEDEKAFLSPEDELLIERLVDGELSDEEREDLLYRLDEKIDGWRFCALSFLEAQSFRSALKNMTKKKKKTPIAARLPRRLLRLPIVDRPSFRAAHPPRRAGDGPSCGAGADRAEVPSLRVCLVL